MRSDPEYQRKYQKNLRVQRAANKPPKLCQCGCGAVVVRPNKYTDDCREVARAKSYQAYLDRSKAERCIKIVPEAKPEPRKRPKKLMTDAEQHRIDKAVNERLRIQCGYGNGPVKVYRGEEIATVCVTPIEQIRHRSFGVRESGDAYQ